MGVITYANAAHAIRDTNATASYDGCPHGIQYLKGKGWQAYDLTTTPRGEPEFICFGSGRLPLPLTEEANEVLASAIRSHR